MLCSDLQQGLEGMRNPRQPSSSSCYHSRRALGPQFLRPRCHNCCKQYPPNGQTPDPTQANPSTERRYSYCNNYTQQKTTTKSVRFQNNQYPSTQQTKARPNPAQKDVIVTVIITHSSTHNYYYSYSQSDFKTINIHPPNDKSQTQPSERTTQQRKKTLLQYYHE